MTCSCKLNNEAAVCIQNEDYEEAVSLLQKAMKKVRLAMSGDLGPSLYEAGHQFEETGEAEDFCRFLSPIDSSFCGNSTLDGENKPINSLFSSPILLSRCCVNLWDAASCERFSYVAVYNLALTHHLMAITSTQLPKRTSRLLLQRAVILYEKAHYVLMNSPEMDISVLHALALWSNLGHAHSALGEKLKSEVCYQNLLSTILYVVDNGRCNERGNETIPIDGFFSNVMPLLKNGSVAPAA